MNIKLSDIEGLEEFDDYGIEDNGNVWSFKYKKPRILKPFIVRSYPCVKLMNKDHKLKYFYVHRLVALAFLPTDDYNRRIIHKNKIHSDNHVDNLEWYVKKSDTHDKQNFILNDEILNRIQQVHLACTKKGIKTGNSYEFTNMMINNALDEYIIRYGLRKVM